MQKFYTQNFKRISEEIPELRAIEPHIDDILLNKETLTSKEIDKLFQNIIDNFNRDKSRLGDLNFYPSNQTTNCKKNCLSIATDKFGWKYRKDKCRTGFKGLIKELIEYWFHCGSINEKTVIITLDWDDKDFERDWKKMVDAYVSRGKIVKIYEVIESKGEYILRYPN
jgi:hypothetical protein